jgi:hypothetical protein
MSLYDQVLKVATLYLGPAAEKFISRQIKSHLNLATPQALSAQALPELARWCEISGALIMDKAKAEEFSKKVKAIR